MVDVLEKPRKLECTLAIVNRLLGNDSKHSHALTAVTSAPAGQFDKTLSKAANDA